MKEIDYYTVDRTRKLKPDNFLEKNEKFRKYFDELLNRHMLTLGAHILRQDELEKPSVPESMKKSSYKIVPRVLLDIGRYSAARVGIEEIGSAFQEHLHSQVSTAMNKM